MSPLRCAFARHGGLALSLLGLCAPALSQLSPPPQPPAERTGQELLRRQEERQHEQPSLPRGPDALQPTPAPLRPGPLPAESPCFVIQEVALTGPDARRYSWLVDAALPYLGHCLGEQGLARIVADLDAQLIKLGYATSRVTLSPQNLQQGKLLLQLHAGRIASITIVRLGPKGPEPDDAWGTWRNAFPTSPGDVLNVRDLEQGIEQMKRLPSQNVTTTLEPGDAPDTSIVTIQRQAGSFPDRLRGGLTLDNSGSAALGRGQLFGQLALDNPLGLNDIINLGVNTNIENPDPQHRSQSLSLGYSLPWGYNTFTLSHAHNRYAQVVQGTTVNFLSSGYSDTNELRGHRTLLRTASWKAGVYAALETRRARSYLDDVELVVQRRRTTNFETGATWRMVLERGMLDLQFGLRRGVPWLDAQEDLPGAHVDAPTLRPHIWQWSFAAQQAFEALGRPWQYGLVVRGQHTQDTTVSTDQFSIGNRYSVRGFDGDVVLLAESGYFVRNELTTPLKLFDEMPMAVYAGVDFGRVWGPSATASPGERLVGAAAGMRGQWRGLQAELALATPIDKPEGFQTQRWSAYASATYAF